MRGWRLLKNKGVRYHQLKSSLHPSTAPVQKRPHLPIKCGKRTNWIKGIQVIREGFSSRFSIAWWFCRFLKRLMRWCSLLGGRQWKWPHLGIKHKKKKRSNHLLRWRFYEVKSLKALCTCVALKFLHDLFCLQVPDVNHVVLRARYDPLKPRAAQVRPFHQNTSFFLAVVSVRRALTFPPVTEKLANMQYFSFLWPVYVFKHWEFT